MDKVLRFVVGVPGVVFVVIGIGWLVVPAEVGRPLGMTLPDDGLGLSTQIGAMASFFLTLGGCILIALVTGHRVWYYPAIMLLCLAAIGRIVAWQFYDAVLAFDMICVEGVVAVLLYVVSRARAEKVAVHPS